jgi:hypothetical protein
MSLWMSATNVKYDCLAHFRVVGSPEVILGNLLGNSRVTHQSADLPHLISSYRNVLFAPMARRNRISCRSR